MTGLLEAWASKWGVPPEALQDLQQTLATPLTPDARLGDDEAAVISQVRLEGSKAGWRLFRNNVGACYDKTDRFIRYGLANDSKKLNDAMKSSDLIGIRPIVIDPTYLGRTIGQFVALECKRPNWTFRNTARERAQQHFLGLIASHGGHAHFTTGGLR